METFKERLLEAIKKLLTSGKVLTALVGLIVGFAAKRGIVLDPSDVNLVIALFGVLLLGQGAADFGKSAAIIQAVNPPPPTQEQTVNVAAPQAETPLDLPRNQSRFS